MPLLDQKREDNPWKAAYQRSLDRDRLKNLTEMGDFRRGLNRGWQQLQGTLYGAAGLAGSALDSESVRDWGYEGYQRNMEEAAQYPGVKFEDSPIDWAQGMIGEILPSMGEAAVGAGVGTLLAPGAGTVAGGVGGRFAVRAAINRMVKQGAKKYLKENIGKGVTKEAAEEFAKKRVQDEIKRVGQDAFEKGILRNLGAKTGVVGAVTPMEAGGNWGELMEQGIDNPVTAFATGLGAAFLELAGGNIAVVNRVLGQNTAKVFRKALENGNVKKVAHILGTATKQGGEEAAQEMGQELLSLTNVAMNDPEFETFSKENLRRIWESGGAGALAGILGGGFTGVTTMPQATETPTDQSGVPTAEQPDVEGLFTQIHQDLQAGNLNTAQVNAMRNQVPEGVDPTQWQSALNDILASHTTETAGAKVDQEVEAAVGRLDEQLRQKYPSMKSAEESALVFEEEEAKEQRVRQSPQGYQKLKEQLAERQEEADQIGGYLENYLGILKEGEPGMRVRTEDYDGTQEWQGYGSTYKALPWWNEGWSKRKAVAALEKGLTGAPFKPSERGKGEESIWDAAVEGAKQQYAQDVMDWAAEIEQNPDAIAGMSPIQYKKAMEVLKDEGYATEPIEDAWGRYTGTVQDRAVKEIAEKQGFSEEEIRAILEDESEPDVTFEAAWQDLSDADQEFMNRWAEAEQRRDERRGKPRSGGEVVESKQGQPAGQWQPSREVEGKPTPGMRAPAIGRLRSTLAGKEGRFIEPEVQKAVGEGTEVEKPKAPESLEDKAKAFLAEREGVSPEDLTYSGDMTDGKELMLFNLDKKGHPKDKSTLAYVKGEKKEQKAPLDKAIKDRTMLENMKSGDEGFSLGGIYRQVSQPQANTVIVKGVENGKVVGAYMHDNGMISPAEFEPGDLQTVPLTDEMAAHAKKRFGLEPTKEAPTEPSKPEEGKAKPISESLAEAEKATKERDKVWEKLESRLPEGTTIKGWKKETVDGETFWTKGDKGITVLANEVGGKEIAKRLNLPEDAAFNPENYIEPTPQEVTRETKEPWEMTKRELADNVQAVRNRDGSFLISYKGLPLGSPSMAKKYNDIEEYFNAAHKQEVELAITEGKPVPKEVLAEYPHLQKQVGPEPDKPEALPKSEISAKDLSNLRDRIKYGESLGVDLSDIKAQLEMYESGTPGPIKEAIKKANRAIQAHITAQKKAETLKPQRRKLTKHEKKQIKDLDKALDSARGPEMDHAYDMAMNDKGAAVRRVEAKIEDLNKKKQKILDQAILEQPQEQGAAPDLLAELESVRKMKTPKTNQGRQELLNQDLIKEGPKGASLTSAGLKELKKLRREQRTEQAEAKEISKAEEKRLIAKAFEGKKSAAEDGRTPDIVFTGGLPGAGKSSGVVTAGVKNRSVIGNPDHIKKLAGKSKASAEFHEESSRIAKKVLNRALKLGYDTVWDSQLTNFPLVDRAIKRVLSKDGNVAISFSHIDYQTSKVRSSVRKITGESERDVPDEAIIKGYNRSLPTFLALYKKYKRNPDVHFFLYENNRDSTIEKPEEPLPIIVDNEVLEPNILDNLLKTEYIKEQEGEGDFRYERKEKATIEDLEAVEEETLQRIDRVLSWKGYGAGPQAKTEAPVLKEEVPPQPEKPAAEMSPDELLAEWDRQAAEIETQAGPTPPTAKQKAAEATQHLSNAVDKFKQINKILGEEGSLSDKEVDESKWELIRPLLKEAWNEIVAAGKAGADFVQLAMQNLSPKGRPYFEKFVREEIGGEKHEKVVEEGTAGHDRTGDERQSAEPPQGTEGAGKTEEVPATERRGPDERVRSGSRQDRRRSRGQQPAVSEESAGVEYADAAGVAHSSRQPSGVPDFRIEPGGLKREGSWKEAAKRNLDIIELVKTLDKEGRQATPEEQALLSKYTGFGATEIANNLFPGYAETGKVQPAQAKPGWQPLVERLKSILSEDEIRTAAKSTQYAHYTSEGIGRSIYNALERMGFAGGKAFEPGAGIASFWGFMPDHMRAVSNYTAIEMDHLTHAVAKHLYPQQTIIQGDFTKHAFPENFFDLGIGNPPFSSVKILADPKYKKQGFKLHEYFFAKSIDSVRPGGMVVFITSRYAMDKRESKTRQYLADRADFIGAIRLPQTAFKKNAGTEVVTDIIFLRKKEPGVESQGEPWLSLADVKTPEGDTQVNEYYAAHPEMVLGTHSLSGTMYGPGQYTVLPFDGNIEEHFEQAIQKLPENIYSTVKASPEVQKNAVTERDFNPKNTKEGGLYLSDSGEVMLVEHGSGVPLSGVSPTNLTKLKRYVKLRDTLKQAMYDQLNDLDWEKSLKELNLAYKRFVKRYGPVQAYTLHDRKSLNKEGEEVVTSYKRYKNRALFEKDVEWPLVWALEVEQGGEIKPSPTLAGRSLMKPERKEPQSLPDALTHSLDLFGKLDLDYIAEKMNVSRETAIEGLGDLIYEDHSAPGTYLTRDEYLSGNVREKLEQAEVAAQSDERFRRNVTALREVQPAPLTSKDVTVALGAPWVDTKYIEAFAEEVLEENLSITYHAKANAWKVRVKGGLARAGRGGMSEWATPERAPNEILEAVLNNRSIVVRETFRDEEGKKRTQVNPSATAAANEKAKEMKTRFKTWVWADSSRTKDLLETYNRQFNNIAPRKFDGSHLTLPGVSLHFDLYPHQKDAIWRVIQSGNTYLAHAVGAGKTIEMIAGGMEMRRMGLIQKPVYVVPKHTLSQWAAEFQLLYPTAHVMVADEKNFHTKNRQKFMAQAALNNPDAIIITHPSLLRLPVTEESVSPVRGAMIADLRIGIDELKDEDKQGNRFLIKRMEKRVEQLEQMFDSLIAGERDKALAFEEMGMDFMFVDEAHEFRKLEFVTNRSAKGIDSHGSKKALDLYIKSKILERGNPGRSLVFASGTPITNTMGELYTLQRFFMEEEMEASGFHHFDAWANMFGEVTQAWERNAAGNYESVERFAKFINIPEVMRRVRTFMDYLGFHDLGAFVKRPKLKGGQPQMVVAPLTSELERYLREDLTTRIETSKAWKPSPGQPGNPDPIINIITDGRLASIDMRFINPLMPNNPDSKLNQWIDGIIESWKEGRDLEYVGPNGTTSNRPGATLLAFYNNGFGPSVIRRRRFDSRAWVMKRFKEAGIPSNQVAWIEDFDTATKKEALFKKMNSGQVRILIGSAKKMGTGVNVQNRLRHLHYLDSPWYPSDVEQPHGRILRQGNQNPEVEIRWYATEGSYDTTMWQMVARKSRFIEQAFTGDTSIRTMEDISETSHYEMAMALSSGDQRVIQLAGLKADIERLTNLQKSHHTQQLELKEKETRLQYSLEWMEKSRAKLKDAIKAVGGYIETDTEEQVKALFEINGKRYGKKKEVGEALLNAAKNKLQEALKAEKYGDHTIGTVKGFPIQFHAAITPHNELAVQITPEYQAKVGTEGEPARLVSKFKRALNGLENTLYKTENSIKEDKETLAKVRNRIGTPFEFEAELHSKIEEAATLESEIVGEEAQEPSAEQSQETINTAIDHLKGEEGFISLEGLQKIPEIYDGVMAAAKGAINQGYETFTQFKARMKEIFGNVWDKIKAIIKDVYNDAKRIISNEVGGITIERPETKQAGIVPTVTPEEQAREYIKAYIDSLPKAEQEPTRKAVRKEEKAFDKQHHKDSVDLWDTIRNLKGIKKHHRESKADVKSWKRLLSVPSHFFHEVEALGRVYNDGIQNVDNRHILLDRITMAPDGHYYTAELDKFRRQDRKGYRRLKKYLKHRDQNQIGYRVVENLDNGLWELYSPKAKKLKTFKEENQAVEAMIQAEAADYRDKGNSEQAVNALIASRRITNNGFQILFQAMRDLKDYYERTEQEMPSETVNVDGRAIKVNLRMALAKMGDMRGYYMPRVRKPGTYAVFAQKEGAHPIRQHFDIEKHADVWAAHKKSQGYEVTIDKQKKMPEDVFEMAGQVVAQEAIINEAIQRVRSKKVKLEDFNLQVIDRRQGPGRRDFIVTGPTNKAVNTVLKRMGGGFYPSDPGGPRVWHFQNPGPHFESRLANAIAFEQAAMDVDTRTTAIFAKALTEQVANVIKGRGPRQHMISRADAKGKDVWEGYEEDPAIALAKYARSLSAGEAKKIMGRDMLLHFTGTDISWEDFQGMEPDATYEDYLKLIEERRVDPVNQPNAFKEGKSYMEHMLRNEEAIDRFTGSIKGIAVLKYLGGRVSAPLVNLTAMVTSVPASMEGFGNIPIHKTFGYLTKAGKLYAKYKFGDRKALPKDIRLLFDEIHNRGWHNAQYNREALAVLRGKAGRGWDKLIDWSMIGFGATEQINRVTTIAGAYLGLKAQGQTDHDAMLETAKKISDQAHATYGKANYPAIARGQHPAAQFMKAFYVFKTFSHNYMLTMKDLWGDSWKPQHGKAFSYMAISPAILAGAGGVVGWDLIMKAVAKAFDLDDPEEELYDYLEANTNEYVARFARFGGFGLIGMNLKGSLEIGVTDLPTSWEDVLGAPGSVVMDFYEGGKSIVKGDVSKGIERIAPLAVAGPFKGYREATEGLTTRTNAPIFYGAQRVKASPTDAILRALSFNPAAIARVREEKWSERKQEFQYRDMRVDIYANIKKFMLQPVDDRTKSDWADIVEDIREYNERIQRMGLTGIIPFITPKSIKANMKRSFKPSKREIRRRAVNQ